MTDQNYKLKSFIISFKSRDKSESASHYDYIAEDDNLFKESVINSLFKDMNFFQKANAQDGNWFKVRFVIHSHKDFSIGQVSEEKDVASFAQEFFLEEPSENRKDYLPIIHITLDNSYVGGLFSNKDEHKLPKRISRSFQILDSSIWNKIVPFESIEICNADRNERFEMGGVKGLYDAISEIDVFYQNKLYNLQVAHEYANLNARLAKQAFLSGAHSSGVSPFIFHSETTAKYLIAREFRVNENTKDNNKENLKIFHELFSVPYNGKGEYVSDSPLYKICNRKWRILLLDDKAIHYMDPVQVKSEEDKTDGGWNCKKTIIKNILESRLNLSGKVAYRSVIKETWKNSESLNESIQKMPDKDTIILIEYAKSIDEAKEALKEKKYDLVLIDYLLKQEDGTHYGYELLEEIWDDQQEHNNDEEHLSFKSIKPHRHLRMYCMFISAYSSAVHDRLLAEGLNQSEKYWYINLGACPTNTPQLFLYNLIKLMDKRLDDSGIENLSAVSVYKTVNKIYHTDDSNQSNVRHRANKYYQEVLDMQYYYRKMLDDVQFPTDGNIFNTTGSVLITDFIRENVYLGGLLEHLTQLVHLTAFGTVRQWQEMWEEYIYFKSQFNMDMFLRKGGKEDDFYQLCAHIEKYIIDLKSNEI